MYTCLPYTNKLLFYRFGIKSAILGSTVYYTVDRGIWKDSATTAELYKELDDGISPYVGELKKQIPYEVNMIIYFANIIEPIKIFIVFRYFQLPPLPTNDRISYLFKYYWNTGVKATFKFLVDLPTHTSDAAVKTYEFISSLDQNEGQSKP